MTHFLIFVLTAVSVLMVLIILVQRGRGGGLSGAFGAGGGSSSAFGTKTGDVFTTVTVVLFVVFMLLSIWLNFRFKPVAVAKGGEGSKTTMTEPGATTQEASTQSIVRTATTATAPGTTLPATRGTSTTTQAK